ncbi:aldehyde dehydrogenase family protein [Microbispora cellulosiformans]|uniref:Aldehyde dehydrogenase family protein n=2 Tax=Microbispora cellulosiformans TaxID=2614688 RepID=A0A5J5KDD8_9ACTN|nr:aldehyde dehydrogenase family protein [Microbispora cellulosiformans]
MASKPNRDDELDLVDPRTRQVRGTMRNSCAEDTKRAVARGRTAYEWWRWLTPKAREERLSRLADLIEEQIENYALREVAGTGKPIGEAVGEVRQAVDLFRFYAWSARTQPSVAAGGLVAGHESWVRWEPLGVVAVVVPWNYPLLMTAWRCAPALAAGNCVVVKPAETTPDTAMLLAEHADAALGEGVLGCLTGDRDTGRLLVSSDVDVIAFTGSAVGGLDVAHRAGVRRVSLELGGNAPAIILPDADSGTYADLAAAATYNAGQSCAAPARIITLDRNYDTAVAALSAGMRDRVAARDFGPLNNPHQLARCNQLLNDSNAAVREGGTVAPGPGESNGHWRSTMLLADVPDGDCTVTEEVFGPVLTVQHAADVESAVRMANSQRQALAASVWTRDLHAALAIAPRLNAGEVWVNCHLVQTAELPHGGRGESGSGTDLSTIALHEYQRPKTVTIRVDA